MIATTLICDPNTSETNPIRVMTFPHRRSHDPTSTQTNGIALHAGHSKHLQPLAAASLGSDALPSFPILLSRRSVGGDLRFCHD